MVDTSNYVIRKEDISLVNQTKSHCEERGIAFAPRVNHNQFNEVLEWCLEFRKKKMMEILLRNPFQEFHNRLNNHSPKEKENL